MKNENGLEVDYFVKRLARTIRDMRLYKPDELARELYRTACCADSNEVWRQGWVSVEEQYPPQDKERVYLCSSEGQIVSCYWHKYPTGWTFQNTVTNDDVGMNGFSVTHWMPLPEPPKAV